MEAVLRGFDNLVEEVKDQPLGSGCNVAAWHNVPRPSVSHSTLLIFVLIRLVSVIQTTMVLLVLINRPNNFCSDYLDSVVPSWLLIWILLNKNTLCCCGVTNLSFTKLNFL
jgi:hypothetical protein